jgi:hypothetical protein
MVKKLKHLRRLYHIWGQIELIAGNLLAQFPDEPMIISFDKTTRLLELKVGSTRIEVKVHHD